MSNTNQSSSPSWTDIFPFDPYPNQTEGINTAIRALKSDGVYLLEGPCGTGKTLIGLTAGLSLVRDPDSKFERVLVTTSKKQQLSAFEDDLHTINSNTTHPFRGLTLIGKSGLCPYAQTGDIDSQDIYHRCISLRDNTRQLMSDAVKAQRTEREANAAFGLEVRAKREPLTDTTLSFDGVNAPFQPEIPSVGDTEYCPFYASHITNSVEEIYPLSIDDVTTGREILEEGAKCGTCPHLEMRRLHTEAEVLLGNYKHAYSPKTVAGLTGGIIDDTTLLICDEAHGLVKEVRDQLSYDITIPTLARAVQDINKVHRWIIGEGHPKKQSFAQTIYGGTELKITDLTTSAKFLKKLRQIAIENIIAGLEDELGPDWQTACRQENRSKITIPLQTPSKPNPDALSAWVSEKGYDGLWSLFLKVARVVSVILDVISREVNGKSPDGTFPIADAYELFERWWTGNDIEYFREITLYPRSNVNHDPPSDRPWRAGYYAQLRVNNAIPQNEIAGTLDAFGGAILMSATLSPLDIYEEVTGVTKLRHGTQPTGSLVTKAKSRSAPDEEDDDDQEATIKEELVEIPDLEDVGVNNETPERSMEERRRKVTRSEFDLEFPPENRGSYAVHAPKFTYSNRWPPKDHPELRDIYSKCISDVVRTTPGNVLVCLPSYQEAEWATDILIAHPHVEKEILTDSSSSATETERLKQEFFRGEPKVLTTSLRGTLTEGVDFDGSKLEGVVICGVPITQTATPLAEAIEAAYDHRFNGKGFEYAFAVPAVRKTRQAIGRVIRGVDDVGVRVLVDERYANSATFGSVKEYFPDHAAKEFTPIRSDDLLHELDYFWQTVR